MSVAQLTDARLYYETSGTGPPLVLLPGLGATCRSWDPVLPHLTDHFTVTVVDNRGVGRSEAIRPARALHDYSSDLVEFLDHLQLDRVLLMGLSLGGIIAQRFAVDHPSRVHRLVLVSCTHRFGPYLREMATLIGVTLKGFKHDLFTRTLTLLGSGPAYFDADPQRVEQAVRQAEKAGVPRADVLRQLQCLIASEPEAETDEYRITAPTLVVAGRYDSIIPDYYARCMAAEIPGSHFLLANAGHNPLAECPQTVIPQIISFLKTGQATDAVPGHTAIAGPMAGRPPSPPVGA